MSIVGDISLAFTNPVFFVRQQTYRSRYPTAKAPEIPPPNDQAVRSKERVPLNSQERIYPARYTRPPQGGRKTN